MAVLADDLLKISIQAPSVGSEVEDVFSQKKTSVSAFLIRNNFKNI